MRYSKSMIEAVQQVSLYEMMDYAIIDGDNKIIGLYKGNMAKKQAQMNLKGAEKQVQIKKPVKVIPVSNKKKGDTVIGIGELTDKERGEIDESSLADVTKRLKAKKIGVKTISRTKDKVTHLYVHVNDVDDAQKILKNDPLYVAGKLRVVAKEETLHEDEKNALAGFDNRAREAGSMDKKDIIKAKELYKRKDVKRLRQHIYTLDTEPLETIMQNISVQDRKFFDKMYPKNKSGQFLAMIAYDHRKMDENLDENKDDEKKRMKGAKLKLKMGDEVIKEDGHTDVPSAVRQCKTIVEDATQMMGKLQSMSGEDSLPTWWTNKLAVASNSMNKIRDYLLVPSMQEGLNEREKGIDKLPRQFLNPDKEVMVMKKNKVIVIDKKDQDRYTKQGWELAEKQIDEMKKIEITLNNPNDAKKIQKDVIDLTNKKRKVNITMKQMGKKLIIDGGDYDISREVKDIRNFIGFKSAKVVEDVQPKTFSQKVQEQVTAFGRESFLAENNMDVIKSIVKSKGAKDLKMKDGKLKMDAFTASAIAQVYDKVNPANKKKMEDLANGKKSDLMKLQKLAMKFVK